MAKYLQLEIKQGEHQGVGVLTLNRPEALNALNNELIQELHTTLKEIAKKSYTEIRVLVLTGAGPKAFVAGADIKEMSGLHPEQAEKFARFGQETFSLLEDLKIPTLAAVNGFALGGGLELALSCDFIYASETAKFGLPEVTLGLMPGFGGTVRLSRAMGPQKAKEMIFTGAMMTAAEALQAGFVNKVLPAADLMAGALATAQMIASRGPVAVGTAKFSILHTWDQEIKEAFKTEARLFGRLFETQDVREGTAAFVEKRKAEFKGQ